MEAIPPIPPDMAMQAAPPVPPVLPPIPAEQVVAPPPPVPSLPTQVNVEYIAPPVPGIIMAANGAIEGVDESSSAEEDSVSRGSNSIEDLISQRLAAAPGKLGRRASTPRKTKSERPTSTGSYKPGDAPEIAKEYQPRRSRRQVDEDRLYDGTQLHANHHGYFVHRDYAAHFFRWGFVARFIKRGFRVLDVGCGQDQPLARVLSAPNVFMNTQPSRVTGVDWNPINKPFNASWHSVVDEFDFCQDWPKLVGSFLQDGSYLKLENQLYDLCVNLEVIEHMRVEHGDMLLQGMVGCLKPYGQIIVSTPVFNGYAAANHIHEYGAQELYNKFLANGLVPVGRYGTFANLPDLRRVCTPEENKIMEDMLEYYSNDIVACFLAPKYPQASRNNVWILQRLSEVMVPGSTLAFAAEGIRQQVLKEVDAIPKGVVPDEDNIQLTDFVRSEPDQMPEGGNEVYVAPQVPPDGITAILSSGGTIPSIPGAPSIPAVPIDMDPPLPIGYEEE